ncbi:hypothetical protein FB451DRAFT_1552729 [Mycena latifolia]|nr:hypothetical protein FB451DRAFT_1552729 [Mycena latifolia]
MPSTATLRLTALLVPPSKCFCIRMGEAAATDHHKIQKDDRRTRSRPSLPPRYPSRRLSPPSPTLMTARDPLLDGSPHQARPYLPRDNPFHLAPPLTYARLCLSAPSPRQISDRVWPPSTDLFLDTRPPRCLSPTLASLADVNRSAEGSEFNGEEELGGQRHARDGWSDFPSTPFRPAVLASSLPRWRATDADDGRHFRDSPDSCPISTTRKDCDVMAKVRF